MTPPRIERKELHHRQVDLRFFSRTDGLCEIEGRLVDTKSHPFMRQLAVDAIPPGVPVHNIVVRLVIDDALQVHEAEAAMHATPFGVCRGAVNTLAPLVGLRIGAGWNKRVRELLGGSASCTHIVELLGPMATTAIQGLAPQRLARINEPGSEAERQAKVDSCFAYAAEREVVARLWPHLHRPAEEGKRPVE
ncbi:DUF2889 domain-containing protein [Variovorax rhizosphaerae]|uniref:DUF2889 domain-containing protein n=1 Tax=Variovorax rhizosphaerae TaxID=1836200 RepID=A0ABU8WTS8_9BURK